ncbi:MAG: hypothetical protein LC104_08350 [Bacteroidales bacterium]|nr:hypothetical protein [Bacteroidales bacterium]
MSLPTHPPATKHLMKDVTAGLVVFLVALPLCLGIALASDAPLFSGLVAGIVGGIVVGALSGSHTSVSGPAAGLTAIVAGQIAHLGSFDTFLLAVVLAGAIQIVLGCVRAGFFAAFFPSSVISGLLAAIGIILILKQLPHLFGHDADPEGEMRFFQPDHETTFSEIALLFRGYGLHFGATIIGLTTLAVMILWEKVKFLKYSPVPGPLVVVLLGVGMVALFEELGVDWAVSPDHLVRVPEADDLDTFLGFFMFPDFSQWLNPAVYVAAITIAAVASLESLLNLEAVDKIDPERRTSPPHRELVAQGVGNMVSGMIGGIPVTSVVVRGSVNVMAGSRSKLSAILHGVFLLVCVALLPSWLNLIPLSALAAILLLTGYKLASPTVIRSMWVNGGWPRFLPFALTVVAIVLTDLLIGVAIGLAIAASFILWSSFRRPVHRIVEKRLSGEVVHIVLQNQVSFFNRAALARVLDEVPEGGHVLIDAADSDYIDPDVLELLREYERSTGPTRGVTVSMVGFRDRYSITDQTHYVDFSTRELQAALSPEQVLRVLMEGNQRFRSGRLLSRDFDHATNATAAGQHPLAVVLGCIDSRTPAELIFDVSVGDIFVSRIAGNVTSRKVIGSIEYACLVAGAKLVFVLGHTRCGAVTAAVDLASKGSSAAETIGCNHVDEVIEDIQDAIDPDIRERFATMSPQEKQEAVYTVTRKNVLRSVAMIRAMSPALEQLIQEGRVAVVGAMYDLSTRRIELLPDSASFGTETIENQNREFAENC